MGSACRLHPDLPRPRAAEPARLARARLACACLAFVALSCARSPFSPPECWDGVDNDGDGRTDMDDPGCGDPGDNDEADDADAGDAEAADEGDDAPDVSPEADVEDDASVEADAEDGPVDIEAEDGPVDIEAEDGPVDIEAPEDADVEEDAETAEDAPPEGADGDIGDADVPEVVLPPECVTAGAECDAVPGAGGLVYCGECPPGSLCGVTTANRCGRPSVCGTAVECGYVPSGANYVYCGHCAIGAGCNPFTNLCESPSPRPFSWATETRWSAVIDAYRGARVDWLIERGETWLVLTTKQWEGIATGGSRPYTDCQVMARVRIPNLVSPETSTVQRLPADDFSGLTTSTCFCSPCDTNCVGWTATPFLRRDGLEMFFSANYPCGDWNDKELYVSCRATTADSWSAPQLVPVSRRDTTFDSAVLPVLLSDGRTLIFRHRDDDASPYALRVARRATMNPGDTSFVEVGWLDRAADLHESIAGGLVQDILPTGVGCDGVTLLYVRNVMRSDGSQWFEPRIVPIVSYDPLEFGTPSPYGGAPMREGYGEILAVRERPDCGMATAGRADPGGTLWSTARLP